MRKAVVIGAGIGGLATAIRLSKKGFKVTIFEASSSVGGKCQILERDGFKFDLGPSLLTIPAVYRDLFMKSGKRIEQVLDLTPVDPAFVYHFTDGISLKFANLSLKKNCDEIEQVLGKSAANDWHNLMQRAERMWDISRGVFIETELKFLNIIRELSVKSLVAISPFTSLREYVRRVTSEPHLQMILDRYATYSGSDPRKAPAPLLTIPFIESAFGAWHIGGGIGSLAAALQTRAQELDVEINLNCKVSEILIEKSAVTGIQLESGEIINSEVVVANADSRTVYEKLIQASVKAAKPERRKLRKSSASFSGFSLFIALDNKKISGSPPLLEHHNIWFPKDYDAEFKSIFETKTPVADPTIYIAAPKDSKMVPGPEFESWSVLVNAPLQSDQLKWENIEKDYAEKIISKLDGLGLKVSERMVFCEIRSPKFLQDSVNAPGGAIYGTSSNGPRAAFLRAKNRSDISGLYLVGGSAHPGGGLPLVGISSEIVANAIN
jgi:phytoene desaturase